ncbi:MAG: 4Fe-4S ferredoxin, partial [Desulfuromonadales bacterium]|nr:4Fe-4S ferredoxin [Desulfuromonadales bacterium]NIS42079.1 4Fe-4S ferredoxin [Desulfuromonadales bacterium]
MKCARFDDHVIGRLYEQLHRRYRVYGPVTGEDGVCRLQALGRRSDLPEPALPLIPLKKFLLPPRQTLWSGDGTSCQPPCAEPATALVGIPPCDLHALDYLDRVFEDDPLYRQRRERLLILGVGCAPGPECFCRVSAHPPSFDLFFGEDRAWAGSAAGEALLGELMGGRSFDENVPLPESLTSAQGTEIDDLERVFHDSSDWKLWEEVAGRCLSCGACSAVCPTCYCYDVVDEALADGTVVRRREWDNCFFRSHALVAGGQNFRPNRKDRLRFRFEHKLLGFGALRGVRSCVGCGRCG